ncbi:MAG: D-2-hydroxyacid dehydrogenase [Fimbriimonadaceae bacterium]|nr:D-2-hydroxyacid dehydrogenase [Fimbriimonadaceae bacterium]
MAGPRIVVLDGQTLNPGDCPWDDLAQLGDLAVYPRTAPADTVPRLAGARVAVTNKVAFDAATLAALPELRCIAVTATGYNIIDTAAAAARGVVVCNVPTYSTDSVAQFVMALLLDLALRVGHHDRLVQGGDWQRCPDFSFSAGPLVELAGLTLGVVGWGRIGKRVGELAHAFGMAVIAVDPSPDDPPSWEPFAFVELDEVFALADVVSLHCPQRADNAGFVNAALLARMKPSAWLINTARGGLVNEADLAAALHHGTLAAAAVDVVSSEPIRPDNPLLSAPRCRITPHHAWASAAARQRLMAATVANVRAFLAGTPCNLVG